MRSTRRQLQQLWSSFLVSLGILAAAATAAVLNAALQLDRGPPPPTLPFEALTSPPECFPCESIFLRLEENMGQHVDVVQRGEPKSGTGGMFEWAVGSLYHVCQYLNQHYGRESCAVDWGKWSPGDYFGNHTLVFEPPLEQPDDAPCSCPNVRRVTITLCKVGKHALPVEDTCPFAHSLGFDLNPQFCTKRMSDGEPVTNYKDVRRCMEHARCQVVDNRIQMAIFRDPRPAVVSAFYFLKPRGFVADGVSLDEFVRAQFPGYCKWLAIRLILFRDLTPKGKVAFFWYHEWQTNAMKWHLRLFDVVGLRLPEALVQKVVVAALANDFPFYTKGRDAHLNGVVPPANHSYVDDITSDTARIIDETMRHWLPSEFLEKVHAS